jgi:deoxyribodipyrimidine photo-lyase
MVQVVWFKRDLRIEDHAPLVEALAAGPALLIRIDEPELWRQPDASGRQRAFLEAAADDLAARIAARGGMLLRLRGDAVEALRLIHAAVGIDALWSHMETGNAFTFARDRRVAAFAREAGFRWIERRQFGVTRGRSNRDRWSAQWEALMAEPTRPAPADLRGAAPPAGLATLVVEDPAPQREPLQPAGRGAGLALLESFFEGRGRTYVRAMSSPLSAPDACSRLSPHLAAGSVSMREVVQACHLRRRALAEMPAEARPIPLRAIDALVARLHWHCHFIQKFETEPEIEHRAQHPVIEASFDPALHDEGRLAAWIEGRTGFPFFDACMRSLQATGWINFRMRAMLMAFASYHLALDWRRSGALLARTFTDYESGIHWPQTQMQSGLTGINTPRIYNPVKQSVDQDPDGTFMRRWCPELAGLPNSALHQPWRLDRGAARAAGVTFDRDYPLPIVDHEAAARAARERLSRVRREPGFRAASLEVYRRHGSRKRAIDDDTPERSRAIAAARAKRAAAQLAFDI